MALTTPASAVPAGLFMGDSLAPLPAKIVKKIIVLEYVEMADLLLKAWLLEESVMEAQLQRQKGLITDILTWVQCYSVLVSTLSLPYPDKVPELMAYLSTIIRCQRDYNSPWVLYDRAFRSRAKVTQDLNRSVVNTSLFNLCFGGRTRRCYICQLYLSEQHCSEGCPRRLLTIGQHVYHQAAHPGEVLPPNVQLLPHAHVPLPAPPHLPR